MSIVLSKEQKEYIKVTLARSYSMLALVVAKPPLLPGDCFHEVFVGRSLIDVGQVLIQGITPAIPGGQ